MPRPTDLRNDDLLEAATFKVKMTRGGPWVAARISQLGPDWVVEIDGCLMGMPSAAPWEIPAMHSVWHFGHRISEAEYRHLLSLSAWAAQNQPDHPAARPDQPIRMGEIPISFIV